MFLELAVETRLIIAVLFSFALSFLLRYPIYKIAMKKECYEKANGRSSHTGSIPNVGGVIVFASFVTTSFLFVKFISPDVQYIFLASSMAFALGLYDDLLVISFKKKFVGEIIGAVFLMLGHVYFTNFHGLFGYYELSIYFSIPFTIFVVVGLVNALNLIDGIDGLCSGLSALIIPSFSVWFIQNGHTEYAIIGFSIASSIIPFFLQNIFSKKKKMFLGDNGSLFLGMILSFIVIKFTELSIGDNPWMDVSNAPAVAFSFLAIPVMDTLRVMITRVFKGTSPFTPDKRHFHHRLLYLYNGNHKKSTFTLLGIQLLFIILGIIGSKLTNELLITITIVMFLSIYLFVLLLYLKKEIRENKQLS